MYVNYGKVDDFEFLKEKISLNGSICIARYGGLFRADKVSCQTVSVFCHRCNITIVVTRLMLLNWCHEVSNTVFHHKFSSSTVGVIWVNHVSLAKEVKGKKMEKVKFLLRSWMGAPSKGS